MKAPDPKATPGAGVTAPGPVPLTSDAAAELAAVPVPDAAAPVPGAEEGGAPVAPASLPAFRRISTVAITLAAAYADGWDWPDEVRAELADGLAGGLADLFPNVSDSVGGPWAQLALAAVALVGANTDLSTGKVRPLRKAKPADESKQPEPAPT